MSDWDVPAFLRGVGCAQAAGAGLLPGGIAGVTGTARPAVCWSAAQFREARSEIRSGNRLKAFPWTCRWPVADSRSCGHVHRANRTAGQA